MVAAQQAPAYPTEDALVSRCRAGDLDAFGQVYAQFERDVFRYAYHLTGHRDDADDVKQETFLRAYRAFGTFRSECSLRTWLLRICTNLCRDRFKTRERRPELLFDPMERPDSLYDHGPTVDPQAELERSEARDLLARALGGMPAPQREIIILRDIEGLDYEEIAEALTCSKPSVKLKLFRARRRLKERVEALQSAMI